MGKESKFIFALGGNLNPKENEDVVMNKTVVVSPTDYNQLAAIVVSELILGSLELYEERVKKDMITQKDFIAQTTAAIQTVLDQTPELIKCFNADTEEKEEVDERSTRSCNCPGCKARKESQNKKEKVEGETETKSETEGLEPLQIKILKMMSKMSNKSIKELRAELKI